MKHLFQPVARTIHPALLALALACVAVVFAAQTGGAASAWILCLVIAAVAYRLSAVAQLADTESTMVGTDTPAAASAPLPASPPAAKAAPFSAAPAAASPRLAPVLTPGPVPAAPVAIVRAQPATKPVQARPVEAHPLLKAHHDMLTGLSTPEHLADTGDAWVRDLNDRGLSLCVVHVALEGFESVAERYGHDASDQVLVQVSRRLRHLMRADDRVMRQGVSEFVMLVSCPTADAPRLALNVAKRVLADLQRPIGYRTVSNLGVGCSVGSALCPADGSTLALAMRHAEEALGWARCSGRGHARQYVATDEAIAA